jgi:hypothetical protein
LAFRTQRFRFPPWCLREPKTVNSGPLLSVIWPRRSTPL